MAATRITTQDILNDAIDKDKLAILGTLGDILSFSTEPAVLGAGTDGQILSADDGETTGLKWINVPSAPTFVDSEVPTGTPNGILTDFTLAAAPAAGTLKLYKNGIRQKAGAGNDFTLDTGTITFEAGNIPQTGDILLADYRT